MPSLLPVLLHDTDLPPALRADLALYGAAPDAPRGLAARRRVALGLRAAFALDEGEIATLLAVDPPRLRRAA
jgi:hypothetical protein